MLSLAKSVDLTKKALRWIGLGFIGLIILTLALRAVVAFAQSVFKASPPPPTVSFGKVPQVKFLKNQSTTHFSYTINTVTGTLPTFSNQARVYLINEPPPSLLAFNTINTLVAKTEFAAVKPKTLSETSFSWSMPALPFKRLTYDTLTYNFDLESQFYADPVVLSATALPSTTDAISQAHDYFDSMNAYPTDIDLTKTTTLLLNIQSGNYYPASSLSTAQIIRVDFYQQNQNGIPIFYPNPPYSGISAIIASGKDGTPQIVEAHRNWQEITGNYGTYPIKTVAQAYDDLKKGNAYIAAYTGTGSTIQINNISLGYYVGPSQQKYLMPIIVFQGNDGFYAYISAVTDAWIGK